MTHKRSREVHFWHQRSRCQNRSLGGGPGGEKVRKLVRWKRARKQIPKSPFSATLSQVHRYMRLICWENGLPLTFRRPTRSAFHYYDDQFVNYRKGRNHSGAPDHPTPCHTTPQRAEWLLLLG